MEITPDYKGRNDEYDDNTFRYWVGTDKRGYFYEIYVLVDGKKAKIVVTEDGVSVDFLKGHTVCTNIVPKGLFRGKKALCWDDLVKIIWTLEDSSLEGKRYSAKEMKQFYQKWVNLGKP